jgi:hypothetical protein
MRRNAVRPRLLEDDAPEELGVCFEIEVSVPSHDEARGFRSKGRASGEASQVAAATSLVDQPFVLLPVLAGENDGSGLSRFPDNLSMGGTLRPREPAKALAITLASAGPPVAHEPGEP